MATPDAITAGEVELDGDADAVHELLSLLDTFEFWFNIVTRSPGRCLRFVQRRLLFGDAVQHLVMSTPSAAARSTEPGDRQVDEQRTGSPRMTRGRLEVTEAILVALAALLTAWAAFESTKWGGVQANSFNRAGAARTESVRASNMSNRQTVIDVTAFTSWVDAVAAEQRAGVDDGLQDGGTYLPVAGTQSAFLYDRFRPEFQVAFDAWVAEEPLVNPDAASTPFDLPEYQNAAADESEQLEQQADAAAAVARQANQRGDNYVMMTIVFALALVLVSIGSKMETMRVRTVMAIASACAIAVGAIVLFTFPIEI